MIFTTALSSPSFDVRLDNSSLKNLELDNTIISKVPSFTSEAEIGVIPYFRAESASALSKSPRAKELLGISKKQIVSRQNNFVFNKFILLIG